MKTDKELIAIFDKSCKKHMKLWHLDSFAVTHQHLFHSIVEALKEVNSAASNIVTPI